jgi:hypothetical protein
VQQPTVQFRFITTLFYRLYYKFKFSARQLKMLSTERVFKVAQTHYLVHVNPSLFQQLALSLNAGAIFIFLGIEIFWYIKQSNRLRNIPSLLIGFILYNAPFWILALSMYLQSVAASWTGVLRVAFLLLSIPVNLWLHYHGDKGGNSIGMATVFFLIISVPLVLIIEIFIAFY